MTNNDMTNNVNFVEAFALNSMVPPSAEAQRDKYAAALRKIAEWPYDDITGSLRAIASEALS